MTVAGDPRHVLFRAAGERFALPLAAVREVVTPQPPFSRVPRTSDAVRGVMNLRGRVVAVVDLAALVGLAPQVLAGGSGQVVVLDRARRGLGLLIDAVVGVEAIDLPGGASSGGVVLGLSSVRGAAVNVLDAEALAAQARALFGGR